MRKSTSNSAREQSRGEELANSISHGLALVAMLVGTGCHYVAILRYAA